MYEIFFLFLFELKKEELDTAFCIDFVNLETTLSTSKEISGKNLESVFRPIFLELFSSQ
jgi:hypothetical protein